MLNELRRRMPLAKPAGSDSVIVLVRAGDKLLVVRGACDERALLKVPQRLLDSVQVIVVRRRT